MAVIVSIVLSGCTDKKKDTLYLNQSGYFEKQGLNVLVFSNWYNANFDDSKMSGIEIIHHGTRVVTNGDVRLNPTPEQWDPIPVFIDRLVDSTNQIIEASLSYPKYNFKYKIKVTPNNDGVLVTVILDSTLPSSLVNKAGFNLEFLPTAFIGNTFVVDDSLNGIFPLYPSGPMQANSDRTDPKPIAEGNEIVFAPENSERQMRITSLLGKLMLFDGRNKAQNGWFVLRSMIPANKTGEVINWQITANTIHDWVRPPVIGHSQVGYHPSQQKRAIIELDKNDHPKSKATLYKIGKEGKFKEAYSGKVIPWGNFLRYSYYIFEFNEITDEGLYIIEYGDVRTKPFRIAKDIYANIWHPTLDIFMPVQMDHMFVNEAYRVWHGAAHMDDAVQAPLNKKHFDLYAQGPATDNRFKPYEHIPGLNVGGWFDAGDFDIRTQSQYGVILNLVNTWEEFHPERDETTINEKDHHVEIHHPDGKPDILQQIEHGVLALIAQHKAVGYAINGIIVPNLHQYHHLGDAVNQTDNLIYNPSLDSLEKIGQYCGTYDDRLAFTSRSTALNYGSIAALAAASRAFKGYNDDLSNECLTIAKKVWDEEHSREPFLFHCGNTTGGPLYEEEFKAATELLITTEEDKYLDRIEELWDTIGKNFARNAIMAIKTLPYLDTTYKSKLKERVQAYKDTLDVFANKNPYKMLIWPGGWAGNGLAVYIGNTNYWLHKAFPEIINKETVFNSLNYILGCHPGSDISFVSGVGIHSKKVAYGNNRADFSFIAGGVVPGVLILPPDFPENKEDWPFLWGENEYVITLGASYLFLANAANKLVNE